MNDRLKFRAISSQGEWRYGFITKDLPGSTLYYNEYPYRIQWHPESGGTANCPVKTETIGQWTGLCDAYGREIWEDDIVKVAYELPDDHYTGDGGDFGHYVGVVRFRPSSGYGLAKVVKYSEIDGVSKRPGLPNIRRTSAVVIGNLHENPELLEPTP